jgi:inorganic pyrophosphatase
MSGGAFVLLQRSRIGRLQVEAPVESTNLLEAADYANLAKLMDHFLQGVKSFVKGWLQRTFLHVALMTLAIFACMGPTQVGWRYSIFFALAFLWGALTSTALGRVNMDFATSASGPTVATSAKGLGQGFTTAIRGGAAVGFIPHVLGLANLYLCFLVLGLVIEDRRQSMQILVAYGLGCSWVALLSRVGGGIFTQAVDIGADLVGKLRDNIADDDPKNPSVIADLVGDNVGCVLGMGSDLLASVLESTCVALVISSNIPMLAGNWVSSMYPLLVSVGGIMASILVSCFATERAQQNNRSDLEDIEVVLKNQVSLSAYLATIIQLAVAIVCMPWNFEIQFLNGDKLQVQNWHCFIAVAMGIWTSRAVAAVAEHYTSQANHPVKDVAEACDTGAAHTVLSGLALGYKSNVFPTVAIALCVYVGYNMCGLLGISLSALGILCTVSIPMSNMGYDAISASAGGLSALAKMDRTTQNRIRDLDALGNTAACVTKAFAHCSAALVSIALYGAFLVRIFEGSKSHGIAVNILDPRTLFGLLLGAVLPYWLSAMTMKGVGAATLATVKEVQNQIRYIEIANKDIPNYCKCVTVATSSSLSAMLAPCIAVLLAPILCGTLLGREALAGLLPGAIVVALQLGLSGSNTGGAWNNAKRYIEAGNLGAKRAKGSKEHSAAVVSDKIGDPMKNAYGPATISAVKFIAMISFVLAPILDRGLVFDQLLYAWANRDS